MLTDYCKMIRRHFKRIITIGILAVYLPLSVTVGLYHNHSLGASEVDSENSEFISLSQADYHLQIGWCAACHFSNMHPGISLPAFWYSPLVLPCAIPANHPTPITPFHPQFTRGPPAFYHI